jgi:hypothetical protein
MRVLKTKRYGLRYIETRYRALASSTYLIGASNHMAPSHLSIITMDAPPVPAPYFLWVVVNGEQEATAMLDDMGISDEDNLDRLDHTGFLVMKTASA